MESAAWAREAARRGIPYLVLRAISDAAADELPGYLSDCMDAQGSIRRSSVVGRALAHPSSIPVLLRMRRAVLDGSRRLAALLEHFLAEGA
jgi:adenosylhomocysteine nucleosidase